MEGVGTAVREEPARRAVRVDPIRPVGPVGERVQGRVVVAGEGEVVLDRGVVAERRVVGGDVGGVGFDFDRSVEVGLLPSGARLTGESNLGELFAAGRPEPAHVGAGVAAGLVEADAADVAGHLGAELDAQFDRARVRVLRRFERFVPDRAGASLRGHFDVDFGAGPEVCAVVGRTRQDRRRAEFFRRPGVAPVFGAFCQMPGFAAVDRDFDRADHSSALTLPFRVHSRSFDRVRLPALYFDFAAGFGDRRRRRGRVGGFGGRDQSRLKRARLHAHVGEQVHRRLLHAGVDRLFTAVMAIIETPRPLHGPGAEDERPAFGSVEGQVMGGRPRRVGAAVVDQSLRHFVGGRGERHQTSRPEAVLSVFIPLVAERVFTQRRRFPWFQFGDIGVAPEAQRGVLRRHFDCRGADVDGEDRAGQFVLRTAAIGRGAEPRVAPGAGPDARILWIERFVGVRLLVADERAMVGARTVDAVFPAGLPEDLVAAEEGEVDPRFPRRFDVRPLRARPVLVVAHREKDFVVEDLAAAAIGVNAGEVADVVAVALEPAHHRVLSVEGGVLSAAAPRRQRPVVADLVGAPRIFSGVAGVETVAAVLVVGLPGGVGGLEEHFGFACVVADDEHDVAAFGGFVFAHQVGEVDAGDGAGGNRPGGRDGPVAAVDQAGRRFFVAGRLRVRRAGDRRHLTRAVAAVIAHAVDVEAVFGRVGVDLELDRFAAVDADVGGEPLDARVAFAVDVPFAFRVAGLRVLADDFVVRRVTGTGHRRRGAQREAAQDGDGERERDACAESGHLTATGERPVIFRALGHGACLRVRPRPPCGFSARL